ncbi:MAG: helix-turn-helix domain-containing protein [Sphingomonadales bacterium]|nr:helix-turn-helix domain-containing protein [Sphingomonadales bacterium]
MSMRSPRVFSTDFKERAVLRLLAGEGFSALAVELGVRRKLLHDWAKAYRRDGVAGLNRKRGPKPGSHRAAAPCPGPGRRAGAVGRPAASRSRFFFGKPCGSPARTARAAPRPPLRDHRSHDRGRGARHPQGRGDYRAIVPDRRGIACGVLPPLEFRGNSGDTIPIKQSLIAGTAPSIPPLSYTPQTCHTRRVP